MCPAFVAVAFLTSPFISVGLVSSQGPSHQRPRSVEQALAPEQLSPWLHVPRSPPPRSTLPPLPPGQSAFQKRLTSAIDAKAARLSAAATPRLLELLGSAPVTAALRQCCGRWADVSPTTLLTTLRDYVSSAEIVHNFEAKASANSMRAVASAQRNKHSGQHGFRSSGSGATCVDLELAVSAPYLPNLWMVE